jgi:hypothetical protein
MWENNITMILKTLYEGVDWIHFAWDMVQCCEHDIRPSDSVEVGKFLKQVSNYNMYEQLLASQEWVHGVA